MRHRSSRGSLLLLLICLVPLVALVFVFAVKCVAVVIAHERHVAAAQAAALTAAKDLSRIVIDDPYFGYISLADQPPIGNGTLAEDGEPLPVTGINTIIGTARLDYIIANAIGDDDLISEARMEAHQARRAAIRLSHALAKSLNQGNNQYTDLDGKKISPYKDAFETYKQNLKTDAYLSKATIDEFTLELGWLSKAATTQTPMPKPEQYASLPNGIKYSATYPGFVNLPVGNEDFYFAGLATRPALVDEHNFQLFDSQHPSTIVRVSSNVSVSLPTNDDVNLCADSCAMPFATADKQPGCCFVLSFCDGVPHRLRSLHDLLSDQSMERSQVSPLTASGGDYPDDTQAALRPAAGRTTLNRMFARGFLHWLRTAHTRPRVDSAISVINAPLKVVPNPYTGRVRPIVYWIDENGEMLVSAPAENPFSQQTVFQNQDSLLAYDSVNLDSKFWTVSLRDLVSRLGNQEGGKHAGQPLAPSKNWRSISGGLPITERSPAAPSANAAAANATTLPRVRNFYQEGRLAFEFQLMAPRAISAQLNSTH